MAIKCYFVYLIGCEWKGNSIAGVNLQISEITLLCTGCTGVGLWGANMDTSLNGNGKIGAGAFKLGQYTCLPS